MATKVPPTSSGWSEILEQFRKLAEDIFTKAKEAIGQQKIGERLQNLWKRRKTRKASLILSHWHKLFEGFQDSPQRIYSLIEEAIGRREIPDVDISRINYPEAGALSARREYLRVRRKDHIFDICAAPFGTGFFVSWWLGEPKAFFWLLASIIFVLVLIIGWIIGLPWWLPPLIGLTIVVLWRLSLRPTYYRLDTALMFQDSVHSAVLEVMGQVTEGKGVRVLTELEKKPILSDLFKRKFA